MNSMVHDSHVVLVLSDSFLFSQLHVACPMMYIRSIDNHSLVISSPHLCHIIDYHTRSSYRMLFETVIEVNYDNFVTYSIVHGSRRFCYHSNMFNERIISSCPNYRTFSLYSPVALLKCGDVESNPGPNTNLNIAHMNARSVFANNDDSKLGQILTQSRDYNWDVIGVTETWLKPTDPNHLLNLDGFMPPERCDRLTKRGGGVMIYCSTSVSYIRRHDLENLNTESVWVEIHCSSNKTVLCGVFYRAPNQSAEERDAFLTDFESSVTAALSSEADSVIISGDFNDRCVEWNADHSHSELRNRLRDISHLLGLCQIINEPTHVNNEGRPDHLLDLLFTNTPDIANKPEVLSPLLNCDHCVVSCSFQFIVPKCVGHKRYIWNFNKGDFHGLNTSLACIPWDNILQRSSTVDAQARAFTDTLFDAAKLYIPFHEITVKPTDKPWITSKLKQMIRCRNRSFKRYLNTKKTEHLDIYRKHRNDALSENRKLKVNYNNNLESILSKPSENVKQFWHLAKTCMGDKTTFSIPTILTDDDVPVNDSLGKANLFNNYFASQCRLPITADKDQLTDCQRLTNIRKDTVNFDVIDIYKVLCSLKPGKATGPDLIGNRILRNCAAPLARPLYIIFTNSIDSESYPSVWKTCNVIPVHKKNSRHIVQNYRPISLLCNASKVLERILYVDLYNYLTQNKLLTPANSGFKKGDGTINQLIYLIHNIYMGLENNKDVKLIFLDFSKAFDRVWHKGLIYKLERLGIGGKLLGLLKDYLSDRSQRVAINGVISDEMPVRAGVPQGSILGPLLFLVYINDLPDCVSCNVNLFADDSTIWIEVNDPIAASNKLNEDLSKVHAWATKWHMTLNAEKTEVLTISTKRNKLAYPDLLLDGVVLSEVTSHKHLGLTISSDMTWNKHVDRVCKSAGLRLNILRKMSFKLNRRVLELLYIAYVRPIVEYASSIFGDQSLLNDQKLERIQSQAALVCSGALFNTSRDRIVSEMGWAKLAKRRNISKLSLVYKALNNMCPVYLTNIYIPLIPHLEARYDLRVAPRLKEPRCKTERLRRSFVPSSVRLWNSLTDAAVNCRTLSSFCSTIKFNILPEKSPIWYSIGKIISNKLQTRLRLNNSKLNSDLFRHNLADDPSCSCGFPVENTVHYFLECPLYNTIRIKLLRDVRDIISPNVNINLLPNIDKSYFTNLLIAGNPELTHSDNINIAYATQSFLIKSGRFS